MHVAAAGAGRRAAEVLARLARLARLEVLGSGNQVSVGHLGECGRGGPDADGHRATLAIGFHQLAALQEAMRKLVNRAV